MTPERLLKPPQPLPAPALRPPVPTPSPDTGLDLDAQIDLVEQRLVAREAWVRATTAALTHRAQVATTPAPWLLPVAGAVAVLWLGWRWWRRPGPAQARPAARPDLPTPSAGRQVDSLADLPWAALTALAWPLAPAAWWQRVSPAAAVTVA
nr:hypothetical protein [Aquabacterium sp.]